MLRKILMLCPALAFALPLVSASPSMARPLAVPAHPAEWCWGDQYECGLEEQELLLAVCTQTQIFVQTGQDDRAYDCDTLSGPSCLAGCDAVAGDNTETCRSQCDGDGAMFCAPVEKSRWGGYGPWEGIGPGWDDDDDDFDHGNHFDEEETLFVDTQTCLDLALEEGI
ncbi:hypothetical protein SAMN02745121_05333 [Nannocystis exedens]|uniref:CVNH domain-containing protein n=1 Tax=Nannocystis exedens TaxID=54 RepID=A0A1I2CZS0_9BACT|nr:hypothetical protein [Nannocystis exedens]PCC68657.1 hypothetical protein NAEX_01674 [Nannocystis exedens]SFE73230.1 hypothetical protein SAMN02745121_05333 [Nannocystis exedens]